MLMHVGKPGRKRRKSHFGRDDIALLMGGKLRSRMSKFKAISSTLEL
jgi:hypothetical protein